MSFESRLTTFMRSINEGYGDEIFIAAELRLALEEARAEGRREAIVIVEERLAGLGGGHDRCGPCDLCYALLRLRELNGDQFAKITLDIARSARRSS